MAFCRVVYLPLVSFPSSQTEVSEQLLAGSHQTYTHQEKGEGRRGKGEKGKGGEGEDDGVGEGRRREEGRGEVRQGV